MSAIAAPFGMVPVQLIGGRYNTGGFNMYPIASAYATSIFFGDVVKQVAGGVIEKDAGTVTLTPIGVFLGCEFTDPGSSQLLQRQYWPGATVAADAMAMVCDDPEATFLIQADGAVVQADIGENAAIVQTAGTTLHGKSRNALDQDTIAVTATLPLRLLKIHEGPENVAGDAFTDVIVKFVNHTHTTALGV